MARIPSLAPTSRGRRALLGLLLGAAIAGLLVLLRGTDVVDSLELQVVDLRTRHFAAARTPDERIALMQVEEGDIEQVHRELGIPWPWPLALNAAMVRVLDEAGAACLVVDVLHLDRGAGPDDVPAGVELTPAVRAKRELEAEDGDNYGRALEAFGRAVVAFELSDAAQYELPARVAAAASRLDSAALPAADVRLRRGGANLPVRRVVEGARLLGFTNVPVDADGVVRRAVTLGAWAGRPAASLALAAARLLSDQGTMLERANPLLAPADFLVNHHAGSHARVTPTQVLAWAQAREARGELPAAARAALEGRIVVFGVNLAGLKDVLASPLGGTMDGPVYQATVLDNLLHGDGRVFASRGVNAAVLFGLALLAGLLGVLLPTRWLPHCVPVVLGAVLVAAAFERFGAGVALDVVTPVLGLLITWGGTFALRAFTEGRRNRWLEGAFGRYMAPPLIAALKRDPALLELGGRTREVSVLFSDVAGFTRLSERLAPQDVVRLLNRYLTAHCAAVMDEGGVVDKFEGDAVMAFFGDPVTQPDHAVRACRAALRVQRELPALGPLLAELGIEDFHVRVGLNSGAAVVGNMGSEQRFDYTCMGDSVNLASRIEGAARVFGVAILVGAPTVAAAGDAMLFKPLGEVVVVGREQPVAVFELLGERTAAPEDLLGHAAAFGRALEAARAGDVRTARAAIAEAQVLRPGDGPSAWFTDVLDGLDRAWSGVTRLETK